MAELEHGAQEKRKHTVLWDAADWELIEAAAAKQSVELHLDLDPVDIIRAGARLHARTILEIE